MYNVKKNFISFDLSTGGFKRRGTAYYTAEAGISQFTNNYRRGAMELY